MVDIIRVNPEAGMSPEETDMLLRHNRRLIAMKDMEAGEKLEYDINFGAYRSLVDDTKGMSPFDWTKAQGKPILTAVKRGEPICETIIK